MGFGITSTREGSGTRCASRPNPKPSLPVFRPLREQANIYVGIRHVYIYLLACKCMEKGVTERGSYVYICVYVHMRMCRLSYMYVCVYMGSM